MKITITAILMGLLSLGAIAQQDAGFSMYFFNPVYINPGYAGSREVFSGTAVHRSQWTGMTGSPTTQSVSVHSALPETNVGLGLQLYNDVAGPLKNTGLNLTYAYHLPVSEQGILAFGVSGMLNNLRIDWDDINIDDENDPSFKGNDASSWVGDASAGLYFYKPRFYLGLSANHLLQSKWGFTDADKADQARFYRQYYLTSGVVLPMGDDFDFRPSVLLKFVEGGPFVTELNASFIFYRKLFIGAGYRTGKRVNMPGSDNMLIGILEFAISPSLRIGYSYDYYLNRKGDYNSGTHEFMLGWDISRFKTKMSSPRFF
ncbi:MAG: type IX secretion system membrane protein PorP/SprF [Bacteroidales bacterium]|nr:type IX secretion system membrane protein PorP/SprF [Bacteroidales bacterium]